VTEPIDTHGFTRRRLLALGGSLAGGAAILAACGGEENASPATTVAGAATTDTSPATTDAVSATTDGGAATGATTAPTSTGTPSETAFAAADFAALGTCLVLPDLTQGPFPTIDQIERRDITEGHAGLALRVGIQVVDEACAPIPDAIVEIWHCDTDGDYSAYADGYTDDDAGEGTTFLRGSQVTNADGIVEFLTVYPGWYAGRAVHIHAKVHIDDATVLTTQFLFADALNDEVMATGVYAAHGEPNTTNEDDGVTGGTAEEDGLLLTVTEDAAIDGRRALIVVGLDPTGTSQGAAGGGSGGGAGGPGGPPPGGSRPTP
jgi:protocatechuate 3,4-dioxygenase beta subunit